PTRLLQASESFWVSPHGAYSQGSVGILSWTIGQDSGRILAGGAEGRSRQPSRGNRGEQVGPLRGGNGPVPVCVEGAARVVAQGTAKIRVCRQAANRVGEPAAVACPDRDAAIEAPHERADLAVRIADVDHRPADRRH